MTEAVIVAVIAAIGSVIGQAIISANGRKKDVAERAKLDERTAMRLEAIERKLDVHNGYAEKLGDLQRDVAVITTEIMELKERKSA